MKEQLESLKNLTRESRDFGEIWDYFLTRFAENEGFLEKGRPTNHPILEATLTEVCRAHLKNARLTLTNVLLIEVSGEGFIHGGTTLGHRLLTVFYFEDPNMGMVSLFPGVPESGTSLLRFSCTGLA